MSRRCSSRIEAVAAAPLARPQRIFWFPVLLVWASGEGVRTIRPIRCLRSWDVRHFLIGCLLTHALTHPEGVDADEHRRTVASDMLPRENPNVVGSTF